MNSESQVDPGGVGVEAAREEALAAIERPPLRIVIDR